MNLNFDKPAKIACNGKVFIKNGEVWVEFDSKEDYLKFLKDTNNDPANYDDDILKIKLSLTQ